MEGVPFKRLPINERVMETMTRADQSTMASNILTNQRTNQDGIMYGEKTENGLLFGNMENRKTNPYEFLEPKSESLLDSKSFLSFGSKDAKEKKKNDEIQNLPYD